MIDIGFDSTPCNAMPRLMMTDDRHMLDRRYSETSLLRSSGSYRFIDYSPYIFHVLRSIDRIDYASYLRSLAVTESISKLAQDGSIKVSEGRSGSFFTFTPDRRFIIKTITSSEALLLRSILLPYYRVCFEVGRVVA
jgi:hypothetical protein